MIVDGRAIAAEILNETKERVALLGFVPTVRAVTCAPSLATLSYLRIKAARAAEAGMKLEVVELPEDTDEATLIATVTEPGAHAVIVQLPLPDTVDSEAVVNAIPLSNDADVLSRTAYELFVLGEGLFILPPVVAATQEVLERTDTRVQGARAVVVGQGKLVGQPVAQWLRIQGADVVVVGRGDDLTTVLKHADIIVSGAGSPGLITASSIPGGVVLIDAGTSEQNGEMVGDAAPECASVARVFTPVPGGVGPIAVACLFRNVVTLLERSLQEQKKVVH